MTSRPMGSLPTWTQYVYGFGRPRESPAAPTRRSPIEEVGVFAGQDRLVTTRVDPMPTICAKVLWDISQRPDNDLVRAMVR